MHRSVTSAWTANTALLVVSAAGHAAGVVSDGSDGVFHPAGNVNLRLDDLAPDGVLNFTTVHVPKNVTVTFVPNALNTPVFLAATGDVLIEGTVSVSAPGFARAGGAGGWLGGLLSPNAAGDSGFGPSGGAGGPLPVRQGNAGGGGGMATEGLMASSRTGDDPGEGGPLIPRPVLVPGVGGGGGSGGGGGGGRVFYTTNMSGGDGGGGGGGLQLSTPGRVVLAGKILANGGHGGWSFANVFAHGGPGGGGSGGNVEIYAGAIEFGAGAAIEARGGAGGGLSTEPVAWDPYRYSSGAHGGQGYLFLDVGRIECHPAAVFTATLAMARFAPVDVNRDGDVDLDDFGVFQTCLSGPAVPHVETPACDASDLDGDGDVDQADFGVFQRCYGGAGRPANPACGA